MKIEQNVLTIIESGKTENNLYYLPEKQLDRKPSAGRGNIANALRNLAGDDVYCVELMPENVASLVGQGFAVHEGDFLTYEPDREFDRIVMNPPFTRQQDIQNVTKALTLLKPGGVLVAVMSAGVKFRTDARTTAFLNLLEGFADYGIHDVPSGAFKVSGTGVNTSS